MGSAGWNAPDQAAEKLFWDFVKERQDIWYRKEILRLPRTNWTRDEALEQYKFTNVYRNLDRNTQYLVFNILESLTANQYMEDYIVAHALAFRWFNRIDTYEAIYGHIVSAFLGDQDSQAQIAYILDQRARDKKPIFTSAYISGMHNLGASTIGYDCINVLTELWKQIPYVRTSITMKHACSLFMDVPCIGHFIAYQFVRDLTIPLFNRQNMFFDPDNWADIGPGCKRGLEAMGVVGNDACGQRALHGLYKKHIAELHPRGFMWWRDCNGNAIQLGIGDIENCLCEFSKYIRIRAGGKGKSKYNALPGSAWRPLYPSIPYYGIGVYGYTYLV